MRGVPTSMPQLYPVLLVPGPIPVQVQADFSSLPVDNQPAYSSQVGSPYATPDQRRTPSRRSTASSRHSPESDDRSDRTVNRTMVAQPRRVSFPEFDDQVEAQVATSGAQLYQGAQVATSGTQLPADRTSILFTSFRRRTPERHGGLSSGPVGPGPVGFGPTGSRPIRSYEL